MTLQLAGIGIGPFNLSIAALLEKFPQHRTAFFERKPQFDWHPGLMLKGARMQTCWMKDLVTPVDPTNPHSFLNYLVTEKRFYPFINAEREAIARKEFAAYMKWVAGRLSNLHFDHEVREVSRTGRYFRIRFDQGEVYAENICLGTGVRPVIPEGFEHRRGARCFHAQDIANRDLDVSGKRVAVIGGGQTGAEVFLNLLQDQWGRAAHIDWVSRRANLEPLDETPFSNEYFTPDYVEAFHRLPEDRKARLVKEQKLTGDGISPSTLKEIYQELYHQRYVEQEVDRFQIRPGRTLARGNGVHDLRLELVNHIFNEREEIRADIVIFCTGFYTPVPKCIENLSEDIELGIDGGLQLDRNYRVNWNGPGKIYAVNAGKLSHGIADAQTSLMAWRSATIVNDLLQETVYELGEQHGFLNWRKPEPRRSADEQHFPYQALSAV